MGDEEEGKSQWPLNPQFRALPKTPGFHWLLSNPCDKSIFFCLSYLNWFLLLETRVLKKALEKLRDSLYSEISHAPAHQAVQRSDLASDLPSELASLAWPCPRKQVCTKVGS